jgi:homoserine dehydrogenase
MINIGLLGLGTVGIGVVQTINEKRKDLEQLTNKRINISKILVKDIEKKREIRIDRNILTTDAADIIGDKDINIVIEVMGGLETAYSHIEEALKEGKHVITANKAVVAKYLEELTILARQVNRAFLYEASVGGGIPIIKPLEDQININDIHEIKGILNGTSNYILTRMISENIELQEALGISQELGYAEADPTDDIEGYDTRRKLRILSTIGFRNKIDEGEISCMGISSIKAIDIENIKDMNCTVKLLGEANIKDNKYYASVEPVILDKNSYFGKVEDANNLVSFIGDRVGELRFFGEGAGRFPTSNAILSNLIDITTNDYEKKLLPRNNSLHNINGLYEGKYYLRVTVKKDIEAKIEKYINDKEIAERVVKDDNNIGFITKVVAKGELERLIEFFDLEKENYFIAKMRV